MSSHDLLLDEDEYEETVNNWDQLDEKEKEDRWERMNTEQQLGLADEYQDEIQTYIQESGQNNTMVDNYILNAKELVRDMKADIKGKERYAIGMDADEYEQTFDNWEDMDEKERRQQWQQMVPLQRSRLLNQYHADVESLQVINPTSSSASSGLATVRDYHTDEISQFAYTADEWNSMGPEEREGLWHTTLTLGERQTLEENDEYRTSDIKIDPAKLEGRNWYSLTEREQVTIAEDDEYRVEDFGYKPDTNKDPMEMSPGAGLLGAGIGSGIALTLTEPMRQSPDPETQIMGWTLPSVISLGSYGMGSIAGGAIKNALKEEVKEYDFISQTVQSAFDQAQEDKGRDDSTQDG